MKIRWSLAVDTAEKSAMKSRSASCDNTTITVDVV